ncbi:MAG TPA: SRPBCC family protein [Gracilimonas sp.]|uniref:SRPBCC family protein n=1 Tax=Gracilimonas sp. TaxID=1974203 RepID=UPI002D96E8BD|nr:SRPBCC family protein [Gracilimonas sp.]
MIMTVEDKIYINASVNDVWNITEDIKRWPEWTPTISSVRFIGQEKLGIGNVVSIKQPGQPESNWTITEHIPNKSFSWETRRRGLYMKATHLLQPAESGTVNTLRLEASGFMSIIMWPLFRIATRHALRKENQGLKARSESDQNH